MASTYWIYHTYGCGFLLEQNGRSFVEALKKEGRNHW